MSAYESDSDGMTSEEAGNKNEEAVLDMNPHQLQKPLVHQQQFQQHMGRQAHHEPRLSYQQQSVPKQRCTLSSVAKVALSEALLYAIRNNDEIRKMLS